MEVTGNLQPLNISVIDASRLLGISGFTLQDWIRSGRISYRKLGTRVLNPQAEIDRLLAKSLRERMPEAAA